MGNGGELFESLQQIHRKKVILKENDNERGVAYFQCIHQMQYETLIIQQGIIRGSLCFF